jgi:hypothetical protein
MKLQWRAVTGVLCLGLGICLAPGCASTTTGETDPSASVVVSGVSEARVRLTAIAVFQEAGYESKSVYSAELSFERRAGLGSDILRGGWFDSKTVERVRVKVIEVSPQRYRVEARAFTVQYPGDRVMEEQFRIRRHGPYRKLLESVSQRVATAARVPEPSSP